MNSQRPDPFPSFPLMEFHLPWVDLGEWVGENEIHSLPLFEYLPVNTHYNYIYICMHVCMCMYMYMHMYMYMYMHMYMYMCMFVM